MTKYYEKYVDLNYTQFNDTSFPFCGQYNKTNLSKVLFCCYCHILSEILRKMVSP